MEDEILLFHWDEQVWRLIQEDLEKAMAFRGALRRAASWN
jgi:hypothetical protein